MNILVVIDGGMESDLAPMLFSPPFFSLYIFLPAQHAFRMLKQLSEEMLSQIEICMLVEGESMAGFEQLERQSSNQAA